MTLRDDIITIERHQLDDWFKMLLKHPEPVWSGDVTSNRALERMKEQGLARELEDGWHLTDLALASVRKDNIRVDRRAQ